MPDPVEVDPVELVSSFAESTMVGHVGTFLQAGRVRDPSGGYSPTVVRGTGGNFGLYDTYRLTESMIFDSVQSATELVVSASPKIVMPKRVRRSQESAVRAYVDAQNAALETFRCVDGGWTRFVEEAMSQVFAGFAVLEPRFTTTHGGGYLWTGAEPRIQSTVDRWIMRGDELQAIQFRTFGSTSDEGGYVLPAIGPRVADRHVLLFRFGGYGLDWEGDPPTRPSLHWVKMKRLISQIVPAAAEKYGVPITYLRYDPEFMRTVQSGAITDLPDMQAAYDIFLELQAQDVPVSYLGEGIVAETTAPPNTMPSLDSWIQYCDQMIAFPFSNEGNLMGLQSSAGSYAQAEVRERRFLRSAPTYHRRLVDPINEQILKPMVREQIGDLLEYPRLELSTSRTTDNSAWIADARALFGPNLPVDQWPEPWRAEVYERMGVRGAPSIVEDVEVSNVKG